MTNVEGVERKAKEFLFGNRMLQEHSGGGVMCKQLMSLHLGGERVNPKVLLKSMVGWALALREE